MSDWQAAQHQDELVRMERAEQIIRAAELRPLDEEERMFIATEVGLGSAFRKLTHNPRKTT